MKKLTPVLRSLVKILSDQQRHSGHDLSLLLHVSRNAVWKHINQLIKYGIAIESIQSTGYRLATPLCLLDESEIRSALHDQNVEIELLGSVSSTNDFPKKEGHVGPMQFRLAEHQSKGRGRFSRAWIAPFGANILLSCRFSILQDLSQCGGLSLCVGLSVLKALREFGLEELSCKWPNDILYRNQKLAGVLIELQGEAHGGMEAIVGIGCNVNMSAEMLACIDRPSTSMQIILSGVQDRNRIAALLMNALSEYFERFEKGGFSGFLSEWKASDVLQGKEISLHLGASNVKGVVVGVDAFGHLLLLHPSGEIEAYSAGEASLSK
ncbi:MAG: biotin--[acetyl-CoA-carboxylase] ligase [Gammaproteobacteria bacterium]|nr:biotin--[acetyl-CoA-carboxylase] ligase [Gammaproteobacteria bacterium]